MPGSQPCSEGGDSVNGAPGLVSSTEMCKQLYIEAVDRGIRINGKLCNAVMVGFGSDLTVSVKLNFTPRVLSAVHAAYIARSPSFLCSAVVHYLKVIPMSGRCGLMAVMAVNIIGSGTFTDMLCYVTALLSARSLIALK